MKFIPYTNRIVVRRSDRGAVLGYVLPTFTMGYIFSQKADDITPEERLEIDTYKDNLNVQAKASKRRS